MPAYFYKAKKDAGVTITGQISAQNEDEAIELINQLGLVPVSVQEGEGASEGSSENIQTGKIKSKELYFFSKQLSSLIKSGVPLLKALEVISGQTKSVRFSKVVTEIALGVKSGRSFSSCLGDYSDIFSPLFVAMVKAGEEMGRLREMLNNISDFLKKQDEFSSKVRSAMVYPAIMLFVGCATVFFILTFVMPKVAVIFVDSGQKLPMPTQIVMSVSHFLKRYWLLVAVGVTGLSLGFLQWKRTVNGTIAWGQICLNTPWVKDFVIKADLARFCRTLHLLIESGLPLIRALETAIPIVHNPQLKAELLIAVEALAAGDSFGRVLKNSELIPTMTTQIIAVGEESGSLNESLSDIADSYESDIDESTRLITTVLEPLMILSIGLVIGFIVFAMLLPIFSMDLLAR